MKHLRSFFYVTIIIVVVLVLSACEPISMRLIAAVEDNSPPRIYLTSPVPDVTGDPLFYYSTIEVEGYIEDDALSSGDGIGLIASLSFSIASDLAHRGKLDFDIDGLSTKDDDFGSVDILFDSLDQSFSFSVNTDDLGYQPSTLNLRITVEDFNGNISTLDSEFKQSDGPVINLIQPDAITKNFVEGAPIQISGTVADSFFRQSSTNEIEALRLEVPALGIDVSIPIDESDGSISLLPRSGSFDFNYIGGAAGEFQCLVNLQATDSAINTLTIRVSARDKNNNWNSAPAERTLTKTVVDGPIIGIYVPVQSGTYYYTTKNITNGLLHISSTGTLKHLSSLQFYGYVLPRFSGQVIENADIAMTCGSEIWTMDLLEPFGGIPQPYYFFNRTIYSSDFQTLGGNPAEITVTTDDDSTDNLSSEESWEILEDSEGPIFRITDVTTVPDSTSLGTGATVTLSIDVDDGFGTGLDATKFSGNVGSISLSAGDFSPVDDSYEATVTLTDATQNNGVLDIEIIAFDNIGNSKSLDETGFTEITYYKGTPNITSVNIRAEDAPVNAAKPGDWIAVTVTADQNLDSASDKFKVQIAGGFATDISGSGTTLTARRQIPISYTGTEVGIDITLITNSVGSDTTDPVFTPNRTIDFYEDPPDLQVITMNSATGNDEYAADGETITLNIQATQSLSAAPTVTIGSNPATVTGSGTTWTATTTDPSSGMGTVPFAITDVINIPGASSTTTTFTTLTSGVAVEYYPGDPTLSGFVFEYLEDGAGATHPVEGDKVRLWFKIDDSRSLQSPPSPVLSSTTLSGIVFETDSDTDSDEFEFIYVIQAADIGSGSGTFSYAISALQDLAGSTGTVYSGTLEYTL